MNARKYGIHISSVDQDISRASKGSERISTYLRAVIISRFLEQDRIRLGLELLSDKYAILIRLKPFDCRQTSPHIFQITQLLLSHPQISLFS